MSENSVDTEEIKDLVIEILRTYRRNWPTDIIDQVFLAIELNPNKLKQYQIFADQDTTTANQWIGKVVRAETGLKVQGKNSKPKSTLIKSHSILA